MLHYYCRCLLSPPQSQLYSQDIVNISGTNRWDLKYGAYFCSNTCIWVLAALCLAVARDICLFWSLSDVKLNDALGLSHYRYTRFKKTDGESEPCPVLVSVTSIYMKSHICLTIVHCTLYIVHCTLYFMISEDAFKERIAIVPDEVSVNDSWLSSEIPTVRGHWKVCHMLHLNPKLS
jgi:hypothetical protein